MTRTALFSNNVDRLDKVYRADRRERIAALSDLYPHVVTAANLDEHLPRLGELEAVFTTWGFFVPSDEQFAAMPKLKIVLYAAGTVQGFARPFLERGIDVVSGWRLNGRPVAEFTLGQVLLANKGYFRNSRRCTSKRGWREAPEGPGNFDATVALLGAGAIGRLVIDLLRPFDLHVIVFDPFLSADDAKALGVEKVELAEAFERADVVSNHLANKPETQRMLRGEHFRAMRDDAVFINSGRGATVAEDEMIEELRRRPSLTALLDVTYPEPPEDGSPLYELPNVHLSSHIAGALHREWRRLADGMIERFELWRAGGDVPDRVTMAMLETMA